MEPRQDNDEQEQLTAPTALTAALKRLPTNEPFIPPAVDQAVLRAARRQLGPGKRTALTWRRLVPWAAAAVGVFVLVLFVTQQIRPGDGYRSQTVFSREDLNHDRQVDILDAFTLARQLKAGQVTIRPIPDVNRDGSVDESDVKAIASRAVQLAKGGRS